MKGGEGQKAEIIGFLLLTGVGEEVGTVCRRFEAVPCLEDVSRKQVRAERVVVQANALTQRA